MPAHLELFNYHVCQMINPEILLFLLVKVLEGLNRLAPLVICSNPLHLDLCPVVNYLLSSLCSRGPPAL